MLARFGATSMPGAVLQHQEKLTFDNVTERPQADRQQDKRFRSYECLHR
jgi:hypothetical protein